MYTKLLVFLLLYFHYIVVSVISGEGDICDLPTGEKGTCVIIHQCPYAIDLLRNGTYPKICGFFQLDSIVCCKREPEKVILAKRENVSARRCKIYYPYAVHEITLPGAERSLPKEFPHMAAIGYGLNDKIEWSCGGSLISTNFVLTAAHCLNSRDMGPARWVRLGELDFSTDTDRTTIQDFTVIKRTPHPSYKSSVRYHDIGLIQLDRPIDRDRYVNIACLDTQRDHTEKQMTATGWGLTEHEGESSSYLLKTNLEVVSHEECQKAYNDSRMYLPRGILDDVHICAGGNEGHDTCKGDSGGPLQVINEDYGADNVPPVYIIVGLTSFGKACGISRSAGVYTRVQGYLSWIENIVWPSDIYYDPNQIALI